MEGKENAAFDLEAQYIPKAGEELNVDSVSIHTTKEQVTNVDSEIHPEIEETAIDEINEEEEEEGFEGAFDKDNRRLFLVKVCLIVCVQMGILAGLTSWLLQDYGATCTLSSDDRELWLYWFLICFCLLLLWFVSGYFCCCEPVMRRHPAPFILFPVVTSIVTVLFLSITLISSGVYVRDECEVETYCEAAKYDCLSDQYTSDDMEKWCEQANSCVQNTFTVMVFAEAGVGVNYFISVLLMIFNFDIIERKEITCAMYAVLSVPIGYIGSEIFPVNVEYSIISINVIFVSSLIIYWKFYWIVKNAYDFVPEDWLYIGSHLYTQVGSVFCCSCKLQTVKSRKNKNYNGTSEAGQRGMERRMNRRANRRARRRGN